MKWLAQSISHIFHSLTYYHPHKSHASATVQYVSSKPIILITYKNSSRVSKFVYQTSTDNIIAELGLSITINLYIPSRSTIPPFNTNKVQTCDMFPESSHINQEQTWPVHVTFHRSILYNTKVTR